MTVKELKNILKDVPGHFDIAMGDGESLTPICHSDSGLIQIEFNDTKKKVFVFVLAPCSCIPHEDESTLN